MSGMTLVENAVISISSFFRPGQQALVRSIEYRNCLFTGPGSVFFAGDTHLSAPHFQDCDFAVIREGAGLRAAWIADACRFEKCRFERACILTIASQAAVFDTAAEYWITEVPDSPSLLDRITPANETRQ